MGVLHSHNRGVDRMVCSVICETCEWLTIISLSVMNAGLTIREGLQPQLLPLGPTRHNKLGA